MKALLSLIISGALVVSGYSQTRNVLVGTNNAVVQPTNFWSADASNARTGLGLGTAATNPASAFQPSSLALSNIASNNGASLTNIAASNIVGTLSLARGGTGSTNASDARTALGLGTAATNPATAFQPSSLSLSNLASGDGGALTNIQASNLVGTINITNVPTVNLTNISGTLAVSKGGTGATNASEARQNLGATTVGNAVFVATNAEAARTAINALATNGNAASLTNFPALLLRTNGDGSGVTNISGANVVGAVASASNITGTIAISNVSNLQSSLDGKLGTNPTLAIANISNLQTTLDGKLGTNPTLQISNIAALQTALDGKLSGTFPIAISNVSGLQTSLDGKLGTNPTLAIANITGLQTNLDSKLSLTGNAANLTNFPASLLRTTGDASGLTNFPTLNQNTTGTASNVTGVVAIANGGTGTNSASGARLNLGLVWSGLTNTNAETFRTALGLGSLSTLSAVAISNVTGLQTALDGKLASNGNAINLTNFPTSLLRVDGSAAALTNFPAILLRTNGDAGGLTNFPTLNQNTTGTASNVTGVVSVANGGTGATNAANARTALGLGTAATNPATAFQPSSSVLSNLANNDGSSLTNITASNIGTVALASNITGTAPLATNVTGVVALANGGTGATNAAGARTALGVGASDVFVGLTNMGVGANQGFASSPYILGSTNSTAPNNAVLALDGAGVRSVAGLTLAALTNTDNSAFRTAIGLGSAATNASTAFQPASTVLSNLASSNGAALTNIAVANVIGALTTNGSAAGLTNFPASLLTTNGNGAGLTNLTAANITGTVGLASNVTGTIAISNGGSGAATAGGARTNLGLVLPALTNTNIDLFKSAIALGETDIVTFSELILRSGTNSSDIHFSLDSTEMALGVPIVFGFTNQTLNAAISRTNLGLGWPALTNTTASGFQSALFGAGTNPVLVNTNGEVVSPTNFWQEAPITTTFIESQPTTNSSTNISPSRLLHIHSLATNIVNTTNTIILPTNALTFEGDMALVVHKGPTNSLTQVRQTGSTNNLITLNKFNEAVEFTYYNDNWQFLETAAFTAPIYFSGTNASANAAASRTNLGLGATNDPTFNSLDVADYVLAESIRERNDQSYITFDNDLLRLYSDNVIFIESPLQFETQTLAATTRTNLGLGAPWLTNTNVTNFRTAIGLGATNVPTFDGVNVGEDIDITVFGITGYSAEIDLEEKDLTAGSGSDWNLGGSGFYTAGTIAFENTTNAATTRTNLGLGATNNVTFGGVATAANGSIQAGFDGTNSVAITISSSGFSIEGNVPSVFELIGTNLAATIRKDFGLGATNTVTFAGLTNNGDIRINQTATNNGLLYINRTNSEAFLGLANLIASNNTTISNETLFRVGVSEATNKAAQFGFRSTNTNGNGVAVFSVFGYNALMMIGPSDPAAGTNPIEATIYSVSPTNKVATLITTNTGAMQMHRSLGFDTNLSSVGNTNLVPVTNNQISKWLRVYIGTNTFYLPLYQ